MGILAGYLGVWIPQLQTNNHEEDAAMEIYHGELLVTAVRGKEEVKLEVQFEGREDLCLSMLKGVSRADSCRGKGTEVKMV